MENNLKRWIIALKLLPLLGIAWSLLSMSVPVVVPSQFQIALPGDEGLNVLTANDFDFWQRLVVIAIASITNFCWIWLMIQVLLMANRFQQGELLSPGIVCCLRRFGGGLFALGLSEILIYPALVGYLRLLDKIPPTSVAWLASFGSGWIESFMAGVLVVILSKIFDLGIRLRQEVELTV
ncbi:MAG: DUF2975 domain-containing protein [Planctomycetales bacterium]|nr:DUF2975 domain-containing protein [Planctomycetales bacterium]MCA9242242.1 DUF2975 domain-containing protein [Planctomycetales bacterium]